MAGKKLKIGVAGCGNIAGPYAKSFKLYPELELVGAADAIPQRAQEYVAKFGGKAYPSVDDLLASTQVDLVVNLTPYTEHAALTLKAINAGKHVHSEKPMATTYQEAKEIVELAKQKGVRVSCAPITFMGEAQQTAWKLMREGRIGEVRLIYAEVNHGRIESWHPAPIVFYKGGPMYDVGVYPLALATAFFGPVKQVSAYGKILLRDRVTKDGTPYQLETPDCFVASIEFANGILLRLTANFYVQPNNTRQGECMEFHGDKGSLSMENWFGFNSKLQVAEWGKSFKPVTLVRKPAYASDAVEWSRVLKEQVDAMAENRPHRASAEHAAHVVEVINAVSTSASQSGKPVSLASTFVQPEPMPWAT